MMLLDGHLLQVEGKVSGQCFVASGFQRIKRKNDRPKNIANHDERWTRVNLTYLSLGMVLDSGICSLLLEEF